MVYFIPASPPYGIKKGILILDTIRSFDDKHIWLLRGNLTIGMENRVMVSDISDQETLEWFITIFQIIGEYIIKVAEVAVILVGLEISGKKELLVIRS